MFSTTAAGSATVTPIKKTRNRLASPDTQNESSPTEETFSDAAESSSTATSPADSPEEKEFETTAPTTPMPAPAAASITVNGSILHNEETLKYMKVIDAYQKLGVGNDIELPRLVIAGAQSSGKSSLLESLTGLPVPITNNIATRFPVEITLIEDNQKTHVKASIRLDTTACELSPSRMKRVGAFNLAKGWDSLPSQADFERLIHEASSILGVPAPIFSHQSVAPEPSASNLTPISTHTLRIELRGPELKNLSFIDTPGLYAASTSGQSRESAESIERLVSSLIKEKRTLIVAVMESSQHPANQKIFAHVEKVDPFGDRTIGVLTKPDLVKEDRVLKETTIPTATNKVKVLDHGWYTVMNRSGELAEKGTSLIATKEIEAQFFAQGRWKGSGLRQDRLGIPALISGLSQVYCEHIRKEFPAFKQQTRAKLAEKRAELEALGPPRSTFEEQRQYLRSLVPAFQNFRHECLSEDSRPYNETDPTRVVLRLEKHKYSDLREALTEAGAVHAFQNATPELDEAGDNAAALVYENPSQDPKNLNIYTWINTRYQSIKACHIPTTIPQTLLLQLYKEQTSRWTSVTQGFVEKVCQTFESALHHCLTSSCANRNVASALWPVLKRQLDLRMKKFEDQCLDLIENERQAIVVIHGEEAFTSALKTAKALRFLSAIARVESNMLLDVTQAIQILPNKEYALGGDWIRRLLMGNVEVLKLTICDERQIVFEIHDILNAYYGFSVGHYTNTVGKNVLTRKFMEETMDLLSFDFVDGLDADEVAEICGESEPDRRMRRELGGTIKRLQAAIDETECILREAYRD